MNAKVMLVCDKDVMTLDVSNLTTSVCETLLVTITVSDWNCRAWTFLEAFRARRTIHLLCRNNAVVSLKQVIETIHQKGMLELGILWSAMPHFLPPFDDHRMVRNWPGGQGQTFEAGYLAIETSGDLLSHRPASRPGDDVVIWSLLMSHNTVFDDAESFWKAMQGPIFRPSAVSGRGARVPTGYLISSAPRLKTRGLGWAPASPTFRFSSQSAIGGLSGSDDRSSAPGWITPDGLVADWLLWKFDRTAIGKSKNRVWQRNLAEITTRFLQGYRWGALLDDIDARNDLVTGKWWEDGDRLRRPIFVVCGTNEPGGPVLETYTLTRFSRNGPKWDKNSEAVGWEWKGIYAWDESEPVPEMSIAEMFLIV